MTPRTSRTGALVCALSLALLYACSSGGDDASSTSAGATSTSGAAIATTALTTAPTGAPSTTAAAAATPVPNIVAAANTFLGTLSATEKGTVQFDFSNTAQKQKWSNLPNGAFQRAGLMWGNMSEASQNAWFALMKASMSTEGFDRVIAEWNADEALATTGGTMFGKKYYFMALIGTPSVSSPWMWQWGGHHVTVNATVAGGRVSMTPTFIGVQPSSYTDSAGKAVRPLGDIADEAFALLDSLDATSKQAAVRGANAIDLVLGPGQDAKTIAAEGLQVSKMTATQQAALWKLVAHYTGLANDTEATARLTEVKAAAEQTYFASFGPTTAGAAGYFRVTGPTVVIEYSPQGGGGPGGGGGTASAAHVHGIYRDPTNDYGAKYVK